MLLLQHDEDADGAGQGAPDRVKAAKSSRLAKDIPDLASRESTCFAHRIRIISQTTLKAVHNMNLEHLDSLHKRCEIAIQVMK